MISSHYKAFLSRISRRWALVAGLLVVGLATACASSGAGEGEASATGRDQNRITRAEIEAVDVATLFDVVQRLRPRWLQVRGARQLETSTNIFVFQGQTLMGDVSVLREYDRTAADQLRYLDGARASATLPGLGNRIVEGAIIIDTRAR